MKRNPDLIRELLLLIEENGVKPLRGREIEIEGYDYTEIMSQLNLLSDAGFLVAEHARSSSNPNRVITTDLIFDMTWKGHEYLDTIRDPEVWRQTKSVAQKAGSWSFDVLMEIAKGIARNTIRSGGIPLA